MSHHPRSTDGLFIVVVVGGEVSPFYRGAVGVFCSHSRQGREELKNRCVGINKHKENENKTKLN